MLTTLLVAAAAIVATAGSDSSRALAASSRRGGRQDTSQADRDRQLKAALRKKTREVLTDYCDDLASVAARASKYGLVEEARELLARVREMHPEYEKLEKLRQVVERAEPAEDEEKAARYRKSLAGRLEKADREQAKRLYGFAEACFKLGLFTRAYDMLHQVLVLAPDDRDRYQKKARAILGFEWDRKQKRWVTKWESSTRRTHVLTPEGWVLKKDLKKWESGLRPYKGKWVSIEEEKRIRTRNEYNPFQVESESFRVKTNLGREEAWRYATLLEDFHRAFYRFFIGYYDQVAGAKLLFRREDPEEKHEVYIFPSRVDYLTHVKSERGNDRIHKESAGFYSSAERISRFYPTADDAETLKTFYHEVTHQLFAETKDGTRGGSQGNNWIVEGVATYIETWVKKDGRWYPGRDIRNPRLQVAKAFLERTSGWRLSSFAAIGNHDFHEKNRGLNYALSCALTHFLVHYDDEVYKEDFVRLVSAYYEGKVHPQSLVEMLDIRGSDSTGERFMILERQFREYMKNLRPPES